MTAADVREAVDQKLGRVERREQQDRERHAADTVLQVAGDEHGNVQRANVVLACVDARRKMRRAMDRIDPPVHVPLLDDDERRFLGALVHDLRRWAADVDRELTTQPTLRLVTGDDDDDNVG